MSIELITVAFEIGQFYSNYGILTLSDYSDYSGKAESLNVSVPQRKIPTSLLFNPDESFNSFGNEADRQFTSLDETERSDWFYFKGLSSLQNIHQEFRTHYYIKDHKGRFLDAKVVLAACIHSLWNEFLEDAYLRFSNMVSEDEIIYVIILPSFWDDNSRQVMEDAVAQVDFRSKNICTVLSSEAIAMSCNLLSIRKFEGEDFATFKAAGEKTNLLIVEIEDETNITIFKKDETNITDLKDEIDNYSVRIISYPDKIPGLKVILKEFEYLLEVVFSTRKLKKIKKKYLMMYNEIIENFLRLLSQKDLAQDSDELKLNLCGIFGFNLDTEDIDIAIANSNFQNMVKYTRATLVIFARLLKTYFQPILDNLIPKMEQILHYESNVAKIVVTGRLAASKYLQTIIQNKFAKKAIIFVPHDTSVLGGAVIFGFMISEEYNAFRTREYKHSIKQDVSLNSKVIVTAIDFGTTYSGYAYMSKNDFKEEIISNHEKNITLPIWRTDQFASQKTATALLLKPDKSFDSFGFEAEQKYSEKLEDEDEEYKKWYYFNRFKMLLHNNRNLRRNTQLTDDVGKCIDAIVVFAHCLRFLKDHMVQKINSTFTGLKETDILYVLTVPAIWDDGSKHFMVEAAGLAGIPPNQLTLALEPEAAAILCKDLALDRTEFDGAVEFKAAKQGTKIMVADLGGGTADIAVFEVMENQTLEVITHATGNAWGGTKVNEEFEILLEKIFTSEILKEFKENAFGDYMGLLQTFETQKRDATNKRVFITLPYQLLDIIREKGKDIGFFVEKCTFSKDLRFNKKNKKLIISAELFQKLFLPAVDGIVNHMKEILQMEHTDVSRIIVVGGFSDCDLLYEAIKENFSEKLVLRPPNAGLAVLKGAAMFGHMPEVVSFRTSRYTYGFEISPTFDSEANCRNVFHILVRKGQKLRINLKESYLFENVETKQGTFKCNVYISENEHPKFVTDHTCRRLGIIYVNLRNHLDTKLLRIKVSLVFSGTKICAEAIEQGSEKDLDVLFDTMGTETKHESKYTVMRYCK